MKQTRPQLHAYQDDPRVRGHHAQPLPNRHMTTCTPTCRDILASDSLMRTTASSWRTVMGTGGESLSVASACARACEASGGVHVGGKARSYEQWNTGGCGTMATG